MEHDHSTMHHESSRLQRVQRLILLSLAAGVGYFLLMRHWEHAVQYLPYLILLACPLMHVFMGHGGHGGNGEHGGQHAADAEAAYRRGLEEGRKQRGD